MCEAMADEFFQVGEDGLVEVVNEAPAEGQRELVWAAIDACPMSALRLEG